MKCTSVSDSLDLYVLGECEPALEQEIGRHISACSNCSSYAEELRRDLALFGEFAEVEPRPELETFVMRKVEAIQAARDRRSPARVAEAGFRWLFCRQRQPFAWAAALLLFGIAAVYGPGSAITSIATAPVRMVRDIIAPSGIDSVVVTPVLRGIDERNRTWTVDVSSPYQAVRVRSFFVESLREEHGWTTDSLTSAAPSADLPVLRTDVIEKEVVRLGPLQLVETPKRDVAVMLLHISADGKQEWKAVVLPATPSLPELSGEEGQLVDLGTALTLAAREFQVPIVSDLKRNTMVTYSHEATALDTLQALASQAGMSVEKIGARAYRLSEK